MDSITKTLALRLREIGSVLPRNMTNNWGEQINREIEQLDAAIGEVCSPEQIESIRAKLVERVMF